MKTRHIIETLQEYKHAASNVRQKGDTLPALTGTLEMRTPMESEPGVHRVELLGDDNFEFSIHFKEFVIQLGEMAGVKLMAQDYIPG